VPDSTIRGMAGDQETVTAAAAVKTGGDLVPWAGARPRLDAALAGALAAAGITVDESPDLASVPAAVRAQLEPHLAELNRRPVPPYRATPGLPGQIAACQAASLLTVSGDGQEPWFFVHHLRALPVESSPLIKLRPANAP
jgi:hypothetical protein